MTKLREVIHYVKDNGSEMNSCHKNKWKQYGKYK